MRFVSDTILKGVWNMARRKKSLIPGFSWKRAVGIASAKQKIARYTGIPTTKQGQKAKLRRMTGCSGCLIQVLGIIALVVGILIVLL